MNEQFYKLSTTIAARRDLTSTDKVVYSVIADRVGNNGSCWLGTRRLANDCGTDRKVIIRSIVRLEQAGLVVVTRGNSGQKNSYRIMESGVKKSPLVNHESGGEKSPLSISKSGVKKSPRGVKKSPEAGSKSPHIQTDLVIREEVVFTFWNSNPKLPKARKLSTQRRNHLKARLSEPEFSQHWQEIITTIANTPFLCGDSQRGWKADFDWFIKNDTNYLKVLEGKYAANGKPAPPPEKEFIPGEIGPDGLAICGEPTEEYARKLLGSL